jgi:hypothetical protein
MMSTQRKWRWSPLVAVLGAGHAHAVPVEGEFASHAAGLLVLLGVSALLLSVRNLHELRHKRLVPQRHPRAGGAELDS